MSFLGWQNHGAVIMETDHVTCPLCQGTKKVFLRKQFLNAPMSSGNGKIVKPQINDFVLDCSVCAGNGWVMDSRYEFAKDDAQEWHTLGIYGY